MNDLIGRGGGGGGGGHRGGGGGGRRGGGGGGGGHHHHHHGGGQQFYGGGYGYGYPYYYDDPWWVEPEPNLLVVKSDPEVAVADPEAVPVAVVGAASDDLARSVAAHEVTWSRIARANPNHAGMRAFMTKIWNPWFTSWGLHVSELSRMDAAAITALMLDLARVHDLARAQGIPVPGPTLAPAYRTQVRQGPRARHPFHKPAHKQAYAPRKGGKMKSSGEDVAIGRAEALVEICGDDDDPGDLVEIGAYMAPGARGFDVQFQLGDDCMLHARICVDGQCYEGQADLTNVLAAVDQRMRGYHDRMHKDRAITSAGDLLVGQLLAQHDDVMIAGWWSSFKKGAKAATYGVHHAAAKVVKKFKKPITIAAVAVATVYGGPAGGAAAAKFTGPLIDGMANDFKKGTGTKIIKMAEEEARTNPKVAAALATAKKAVAHTAISYTLTDTMKKAKAGDPAAKKRIAELEQAESLGDFAAKQALAIMDEASAKEDEGAESETQTAGILPLLALAAAGGGAYAWHRHRQTQAITASADEALAIINAALAKATADADKLAAAGKTDAANKITQTVNAAKKGDPTALEMIVEVHSIAPKATQIVSNKARKYAGVTPSMIDGIVAALKRKGATVTGTNPVKVVTHDHGVELRGTYSAASGELLVEVTDSDFIVPYSMIWDRIDPMLRQAIASNAAAKAISQAA